MTRYVALLRGVNVGGRQRLAMSDLRSLVSTLDHTDVVTYVQSGNVVFTAGSTSPQAVARGIETAIAHTLGLTVDVLVRTREELTAVIAAQPLPTGMDPARFVVVFASEVPDPALVSQIDPSRYAPDGFRVHGREIYLSLPAGMATTKLTQTFWERRLRVTATARNWNTVSRLSALADAAS